jgi:hypothetical protein
MAASAVHRGAESRNYRFDSFGTEKHVKSEENG